MSYSNRIFIYGPVGLLLLIVVLFSVYWRVQADTLAARLDRANGGEILPGLEFNYAAKTIGGYPFRLDVVLSGVTFTHKTPDGEITWRADKLALHALSYNSERFILEAAGLQTFTWPDPKGGAPRTFYAMPALARASALLSQGKLARFDIDLTQPALKDATPNADPARTFVAARAQAHLLRRPDSSIAVAIKVENGEIGKGFRPALEGKVPLIDLRGHIVQAQAFDDLAAGHESFDAAAEKWRTMMGRLDVDTLDLNWDGVQSRMKGGIGLDDRHQLTGILAGTFNPGQALRAATKGRFTLDLPGEAQITLMLKDGDVLAGLGGLPGLH